MKWGRRRKKSTTVNLRKKPDESGGTKIDRRRLPTAPLGVEIGWFDFFYVEETTWEVGGSTKINRLG